MIQTQELAVLTMLEKRGIHYERFEHGAASTMADIDAFDAGLNAAHCKNLFLANRQGTAFYLLIVAGAKPFRTAELSRQLNIARLQFGTPEQLMELLGLTPGSVSPMGLLNDTAKRVHVLIDREIKSWPKILVHPNVNTASLILHTDDLLNFLYESGNQVTEVDLPARLSDKENHPEGQHAEV